MSQSQVKYREGQLPQSGDGAANFADDSSEVNVRGWMPTVWVEVGVLFLDLAVWLEVAARLGGWAHAV